jgi:cystathionine beta-lyase/cystathionine gamma-synthase
VDYGRNLKETLHIVESLKFFPKAESLGGIESLCCHPASMTHASVPRETRESVGITDSLVRFSIGIESIEDLIADVTAAL